MRSFFFLLAAALSTVVTRVWDGFRWVCRTVTGTHPLPVDVTPAEAAADAVVEAHRAAVANDAPAAPTRLPGLPARSSRQGIPQGNRSWLGHDAEPGRPLAGGSGLADLAQ